MKNRLLDNVELDIKAQDEQKELYETIGKNRNDRRIIAFNSYMQSAGFINEPKATLELINSNLDRFQSMLSKTNAVITEESKNLLLGAVEKLQHLKDTSDYAVEGTTEYEYRQAYFAHKNNFVWPTQDELGIQEQEKQHLLSLLQQNS